MQPFYEKKEDPGYKDKAYYCYGNVMLIKSQIAWENEILLYYRT